MNNFAPFQRPEGSRPLIYGHRGARRAAPENTIEAFELAMDLGAEGVELDVRVTSDRALVIHHDAAFRKDDGSLLELRATPLAQLRHVSESEGRRIPTLDEVLAFSERRNALLNVELKPSGSLSGWLAQAAAAALRGRERILVSSFHVGILQKFWRLRPEIPTAYLYERRLRFPLRWVQRFTGAGGLHPMQTLLDAPTVQRLRGQGALVLNVWTVNDAARARELAALGVDGVITDVPGEILRALESTTPP